MYLPAPVRAGASWIPSTGTRSGQTCPNNSNNRYGLPERLEEKTGIPYIVVSGDLNDLRCYSEEQTMTNMEAFIEQLAER